MTVPRTEIRTPEATQQIDLTREFAAPLELVWRCHAETELVVRWLGPDRLRCRVDHDDPRHGGTYQFTTTDADGTEYVFRGAYHGDPTPALTLRTFEWLGQPGHVSFDTLRMTEPVPGRTRVAVTSVFQTVADRDQMAAAMRSGVDEGYAKLDALLRELA